MNKALIEGATNNPGAPKGMEEQCGTLPIRVVRDGESLICVSAWKPSALELAALAAGGYVMLHVWGWQPPVALTVGDRTCAQELA